jgi:hypothetical protein
MTRLTDEAIASLEPRPEAYSVPDPELPGHYVRVRPSGAKTFTAVTRNRHGKQIWHTIGRTYLYTLAEARARAREAIKAIREGRQQQEVDLPGLAPTPSSDPSDREVVLAAIRMVDSWLARKARP